MKTSDVIRKEIKQHQERLSKLKKDLVKVEKGIESGKIFRISYVQPKKMWQIYMYRKWGDTYYIGSTMHKDAACFAMKILKKLEEDPEFMKYIHDVMSREPKPGAPEEPATTTQDPIINEQ